MERGLLAWVFLLSNYRKFGAFAQVCVDAVVGGGNQVRLLALHESSADMQQPPWQLPAGQTVSALDCSSASGLVSIGTQVREA